MSSTEVIDEEEPNAWWTTLKHEGVLLSPPVLEDIFPDGPPQVHEREIDSLRREYRDFQKNPDQLRGWLDTVFEDLLGHTSGWEKEHFVSDEFIHQDLRPHRVLVDGENNPRVAVWIDEDRVTTDEGEPGRIGIYSGRRTYADLVKILRNTEIPVGILTNGHQFRVVHATLDRESWTEWDAQAWFEGGEGRDALHGFYGLLSDEVLPPSIEDEGGSLLGKIQESRERQADLSDVMGTQVREAVEMLLQELDSILMEVDEETREEILEPLEELDVNRQEELRARYQAAIRIIMRLVVTLYAENRELFPKENPIYYDSYSVEGLFRELREARIEQSKETLEKQYGAWPRVQSLSRLIYHGTPHPDVPMQSYGGRLFRPPSEDGEDDVLAGIQVFEHDEVRLTDATILEILEKLKIAEFRSGGNRRRGPVDFSELRTEYIGMMYEGLLDYDLREATEDDGAIVFLNIGDKPALPFNVLEDMDNDDIDDLVENLKDDASDSFLIENKISESDFEEDELDSDSNDDDNSSEEEGFEARIHRWARRVVEETGVYMPHHNTVRAMDPTVKERYQNKAARRLISRTIRPGGTYLVSWEGNRKSTGTFYTPPQLAIPTVQRTLEPLVYQETDSEASIPKTPEKILNQRVVDPAMGSGTFPVAALRYLTDALVESFEYHILPEIEEGDTIAAPLGEQSKGILTERLLSIQMNEDEQWKDKLRDQLKRSIVERCIYGVDINPLAVELAKLSLWIETMNPELPFTFLDHKLRTGNSLIGAWLHEFDEYPVSAWYRDGPNDERDDRIRNIRDDKIKTQMESHLKNQQHDTSWFETGPDVDELMTEAKSAFEELHEVVEETERERIYEEEFRNNDAIESLRHQMDRWCAIWFWPLPDDNSPVLDPQTFYETVQDTRTETIVNNLANDADLQFFHWELEFPDVFFGEEWGFDAVLMNPPWDAPENDRDEFFTRYRPHYNALSSSQQDDLEEELLHNHDQIREQWLNTVRNYNSQSHYFRSASSPFQLKLGGGKEANKLEEQFFKSIEESTPPRHQEGMPYKFRGTRTNYYQFFTEKAFKLTKDNGRLGFLSPRGIYTDSSTEDLRKHLLNNARWDWLFGIENRDNAFPIDSRFKYCIMIMTKGKDFETVKTSFMVNDTSKWAELEPDQTSFSLGEIREFSPYNLAIPEITNERDREIFEKLYSDSELLDNFDDGLNIEFYLDKDSDLLHNRKKMQKKGLSKVSETEYEFDDDTYLPVYAGAMIHQFDFAYNKHNGGRSWNQLDHSEKQIVPKYVIKKDDYHNHNRAIPEVKLSFRKITSPTNQRTVLSAIVPPLPCILGNYFLTLPNEDRIDLLVFDAIVNSYAFDFASRIRIPDTDVIWYWLKELPIPDIDKETKIDIAKRVAKLNWHSDFFPPLNEFIEEDFLTPDYETDERKRAKIREELDELVASAYGLTNTDMNWILRKDNNDPRNLWKDYEERLTILGDDGNWGEVSDIQEMEED